jgi:hypothetical protein
VTRSDVAEDGLEIMTPPTVRKRAQVRARIERDVLMTDLLCKEIGSYWKGLILTIGEIHH